MRNRFFGQSIVFLFCLILISGCRSMKNVEVSAYIQEKQRVDQDFDGNSGFLVGTPNLEDQGQRKQTRKIYVVEFSKDADSDTTVVKTPIEYKLPSVIIDIEPMGNQGNFTSDPTPDFTFPNIDEDDMSFDDNGILKSYVEYTVEKDDTLQKISKKFYNSYSKWPRIYEVNKSLIKSPDFIKPGIKIRIPTE